MSRGLIILGILLVVAGVLWPWLEKFRLGRLPGDIVIERGAFHLYIPLATGLLLGVALSLLLWLTRR